MKLRSFISDGDGFSAKDFLMVLFVLVYIIEQIVAFVLATKGILNSDTLSVVRSLDTIVLTILAGVFGVQAVRDFRSPKTDEFDYEYTQELDTEQVYAEPQQLTDETYQGK